MKTKGCEDFLYLRSMSCHVGRWGERWRGAFTRVELVVVVGIIGVLAGVVLPLMANSKGRSDQVICANNLRQIGVGVSSWASDHNNMNPWWVSVNDGGMQSSSGTPGAVWWMFNFLRAELGSPNILACPSDSKKVALNFDNNPNGGFVHANYQNAALSYFVGLHSFFDEPFSILSGDRNLPHTGGPEGCSAGINNAWRVGVPNSTVDWTNGLHFPGGNLLFNSGTVQQLSNEGLRDALNMQTNSRLAVMHVLIP